MAKDIIYLLLIDKIQTFLIILLDKETQATLKNINKNKISLIFTLILNLPKTVNIKTHKKNNNINNHNRISKSNKISTMITLS